MDDVPLKPITKGFLVSRSFVGTTVMFHYDTRGETERERDIKVLLKYVGLQYWYNSMLTNFPPQLRAVSLARYNYNTLPPATAEYSSQPDAHVDQAGPTSEDPGKHVFQSIILVACAHS